MPLFDADAPSFCNETVRGKKLVLFLQPGVALGVNQLKATRMITFLVLIAMSLLISGWSFVREGKRRGCWLYVAAAILFVIVGISFIRCDETVIGILQFAAALGALFGAIYGLFVTGD
jgi:hypothetical protein